MAVRCPWTSRSTSTPGTVTASASLIASSSRGGSERSTGVENQMALVATRVGDPVVDLRLTPFAASRGRRHEAIAFEAGERRIDLPTLSGQVAPVRASNSARSW